MSFCILLQLSLSEESENKTASFFRLQSQSSPYMDASNMYRSFQDANIPFPRTSGAKFSGAGECRNSFNSTSYLDRLGLPST